jgi:alpha-beta hydrolase superfamily lysophospholipase
VRRWSDFGTWGDAGLRREVFFFPVAGRQLYGSLYQAASPSRPEGIVICPSWGVEADRSNRMLHALAFATARLGATAFLFHYPGYGDSDGDLADSTMESLVYAAAGAVEEADRRAPDLDWFLAGFTFGASVACLAQPDSAARSLLLLQPELRPGTYFGGIARKAERSAFGRELERLAFGYPAPEAMLRDADAADAAVAAALAEFEGEGFAARYASPEEPATLPDSFEEAVVPGTWRFGARHQPGLLEAALEWLRARSLAAGSAVP